MISSDLPDDETRALLALHLIPGVGLRLTQALIEHFGSAASVLTAPCEELETIPRLGAERARQVAEANHAANVNNELALIANHHVHLIRSGTADYPAALAQIGNPPGFLYVRGSLQATDANAVALVGARACTDYGSRMAERLATGLVRAGYTVVSGLAYGIDAVAHRAALAAGGRTLAVLAGGLGKIYPADHGKLAEQIVDAGALVSEASMAQAPLPTMFPARNRIISGLSLGVIVVEAGGRSGALITAEHALRQGRRVFAVPGPVDSDASRGTLHLLKQGAILVRDVDDVLSEFAERPAVGSPGPEGSAQQRSAGSRRMPAASPPKAPPSNLSPPQQKVWNALIAEPIHADDLVERSGLSVTELSSSLLLMELQGLVRRLPGNRFERKA